MLSLRRNPLLNALKEHRTQDAVAGIQSKLYAPLINQSDSMGLSPLQIAAYEGMTEVVLALLASEAIINKRAGRLSDLSYKTPLYLAVLRGHGLIAQILLCLGADLEMAIKIAEQEDNDEVLNQLISLTIDSDVFCAVAYWSISHHSFYNNNHLIDLLINQISKKQPEHRIDIAECKEDVEVSSSTRLIELNHTPRVGIELIQSQWLSLAELAMQKKQDEKAWKMLGVLDTKQLCNPYNATALYWSIINKGAEQTSLPDSLIQLTLQQLNESGHKAEQSLYLKKLSRSDIEVYLELDDLPEINDSLSRRFKKIYHAAQYNQNDLLGILVDGNTELCLDIFEAALHKNNYVIIELLENYLTFQQMLDSSLKLNNRSFVLNYMFQKNKFLYELACKKSTNVDRIMEILKIEDDFLSRIFSFGLAKKTKDIRSEQEIAEHKNVLKQYAVSANQFLEYYYAVYFHLYDPVIITQKFDTMPPEDRGEMIALTSRFDIELNLPEISLGNYGYFDRAYLGDKNGPVLVLLDFFDEQTRGSFAQVSKAAYRMSLEPSLDLMNHLLTSLQNEVAEKGFFSYRNYNGASEYTCSMFWIMLSLLALTISAIATGIEVVNKEQTKDQLSDTLYTVDWGYHSTSYSCHTFLERDSTDWCSTYSTIPDECKPLCSELDKIYGQLVGSGLGIAFSSVVIILSIIARADKGIYKLFQALRSGKERLDNIKFNDLPLPIQQEALRVFEKIKTIDAQIDLTLESKVCDAKASIITVKQTLHAAKINRYRFMSQNARVELVEEEKNHQGSLGFRPSLTIAGLD
jgi:hypothetical protein